MFATVGLVSGLLSGGVGVGGAVIATPLIRALGVTPYMAIGTTVPAIFPSTVTGAWTYTRAGLIDRRSVAWTAPFAVVASVFGALATRSFDGHLLMLLTALMLLTLALRSIPSRRSEQDHPAIAPPAKLGLMALGLTAGSLSGLLGVGGGFMLVPAYLKLFRLPVKVALGTSLTVISLTVIPNLIAQSFVGNIHWDLALLLMIGVVPGARLGALAAIRTDPARLRIVIAGVLTAMAVGYAAFELAALSS